MSRGWCDHQEKWHSVAGICRWCAKMELRHPQFNFIPRHVFSEVMPEELRRGAVEAVSNALKKRPQIILSTDLIEPDD